MVKIQATNEVTTTWLGIEGESWQFLATNDVNGRRVTALRWLEDNPNTGHSANTLVLRDMTGDGRRKDCVVHAEKVIANGTDEDAADWAAFRLSKSV